MDPSEVRNQTGSFAAAFVDHEKRFKKEMEQVNGCDNRDQGTITQKDCRELCMYYLNMSLY